MAGTTKRSTTSRASSTKAPEAPKQDPRVAALEAKVAELEASLAALAKSLEQLSAAPAPVSSGGRDEDLRAQLKRHFRTLKSRKQETYIPDLG